MSTPSSPADNPDNENEQLPYSQLAAQHIRELANINSQTPTLLLNAARSISLLTNHPLQPTSPTTPHSLNTPSSRSAQIASLTHNTFLLLNQIRKLLKDQVDALEAAAVIPSEPTRYVAPFKPPPPPAGQAQAAALQQGVKEAGAAEHNPEAGVTNNGLGEWSVAELNARAGVGRRGDEEVVGRLMKILEELEGRVEGTEAKEDKQAGDEDDDDDEMFVDA